MRKNIISLAIIVLFLATPVIGMTANFNAGSVPNQNNTIGLLDLIDIIFAILWPILVAIDIFVFIVAGFLFFTAQGDPDKIAQARMAVLGGILVMAIWLLAFSMPFIIRNTLGNGI